MVARLPPALAVPLLALFFCGLSGRGQAAGQVRWWCDADALDHAQALGRIAWLERCGLLHLDPRLSRQAYLEAYGYPVWSEPLPYGAKEACWDDERVAELVWITQCAPVPAPAQRGSAPAASP